MTTAPANGSAAILSALERRRANCTRPDHNHAPGTLGAFLHDRNLPGVPCQTPAETLADDYARLRAAVDHMADALGNGMTAEDAGTAFTCSEADSIADVFLAAGHDDAAATWLTGHATGDEDEDTHAGWDADDAQLHVQGLAQRIANGDDL